MLMEILLAGVKSVKRATPGRIIQATAVHRSAQVVQSNAAVITHSLVQRVPRARGRAGRCVRAGQTACHCHAIN